MTRSEAGAARLCGLGVEPIVGDVTSLGDVEFPQVETCLYAVGYDRSSSIDKRTVYVDGLRNVLQKLKGRAGSLVYISSSSVYGQEDGSIVDETSLVTPGTESGRICQEAEEVVKQSDPSDGRWVILRLSGIYGPGRMLVKSDVLKSGERMGGEPEAWLNLIHVEDAAKVVIAAERQNAQRELFVVSDDEPVTRRAYYSELARLVGANEPVFDESKPGGRTRGLYKRLSNAKMKRELKVTLQYPTFREGLSAGPVEEG